MGMNTRINPIGIEDQNPKTSYTSQAQRKYPWEEIGNIMTGIGSYRNIPSYINSAFTVGKDPDSSSTSATTLF